MALTLDFCSGSGPRSLCESDGSYIYALYILAAPDSLVRCVSCPARVVARLYYRSNTDLTDFHVRIVRLTLRSTRCDASIAIY